MIYELTKTEAAKSLFGDWEETMIYSCLQKIMGKLYVTDKERPESVMAHIGCFVFYAGIPCRELIMNKPEGFSILVPQNEEWGKLIENCFPGNAKQVTRYAMKKNTVFDINRLSILRDMLPQGYEFRSVDKDLYDKCLAQTWSKDFVAVFGSKENYMKYGLGVAVLKDGELVAGASSYTRYLGGIEIEVDTRADERRKSLATCCCAELILKCLQKNLYPSWDAQNLWSVHLAEKLGYEFSHEYPAYEVN